MHHSKNQWAVSPETIMSHHFRLAKGVKSVVDATPPYSMYNSPISVHYLPKRASSADPFRRKSMSKSQRELNDFVNGGAGGLRLPLPIRSSLTDLVKPKLLENRNYQPPRRRTPSRTAAESRDKRVNEERDLRIHQFKNAVLSESIQNEMYSDQMILNFIKVHMENLAGVVPWTDLEKAADELIDELGVDQSVRTRRKSSKGRHSDKRSTKPPLPFKVDRIASPKSLESLSSPSSSSSKTTSSSSGSNSSETSSGIST